MPGILESMFAGAAVGGGAAMEDVYRRRDQSEIESKLAEQKARADQDRQIALQNLRQQGAVKLQDMQDSSSMARTQLTESGQNTRTDKTLTSNSADRQATREATAAYREESIAARRDQAAMSSADRAAQREDNKAYRDLQFGKSEGRLPDIAKEQFKTLDAQGKDIGEQISKLTHDRLTKPEVGMNQQLSPQIDAQIGKLRAAQAGIEQGKRRLLIEHGALKAEDVVSRQSGQFGSVAEVDKFIADAEKDGGSNWAAKISAEIEKAGIRDRVSKSPQKDEPTAPTSKGPSKNAPTGIIGSSMSPPPERRPSGGVRVGRAGQGIVGGSDPGLTQSAISQMSVQDISQASRDQIQAMLANRTMLSPEQLKAAMDRYSAVR